MNLITKRGKCMSSTPAPPPVSQRSRMELPNTEETIPEALNGVNVTEVNMEPIPPTNKQNYANVTPMLRENRLL